MCGEACRHDASGLKLRSDASKLVREGKEIQRNLKHIFYYENITGDVWMIQIKGTKCDLSTVHPTPYHYHVNAPQFEIPFPTGYLLLNEPNYKFIGPLLAFKDSIEKLAVEVENKLKRPVLNPSPDRNQNQPPGIYLGSLFPEKIIQFQELLCLKPLIVMQVFDSETSNDEGGNEHTLYAQPDKYGFIKRGERWFNTNTEEYWDSNPFVD